MSTETLARNIGTLTLGITIGVLGEPGTGVRISAAGIVGLLSQWFGKRSLSLQNRIEVAVKQAMSDLQGAPEYQGAKLDAFPKVLESMPKVASFEFDSTVVFNALFPEWKAKFDNNATGPPKKNHEVLAKLLLNEADTSSLSDVSHGVLRMLVERAFEVALDDTEVRAKLSEAREEYNAVQLQNLSEMVSEKRGSGEIEGSPPFRVLEGAIGRDQTRLYLNARRFIEAKNKGALKPVIRDLESLGGPPAVPAQIQAAKANLALLEGQPEDAYNIAKDEAEKLAGQTPLAAAWFRRQLATDLYNHARDHSVLVFKRAAEILAPAVETLDKTPGRQSLADEFRDELAGHLFSFGRNTSGESGWSALERSKEMYEIALKHARKDGSARACLLRVSCAMGLGNVLLEMGQRSAAEQAEKLFKDAIKSYRAALRALPDSGTNMPSLDPDLRSAIAAAKAERAIAVPATRRPRLLSEAKREVNDALNALEKVGGNLSQPLMNLARVLILRAEDNSGQRREKYSLKAVELLCRAIETSASSHDPLFRARCHLALSEAYIIAASVMGDADKGLAKARKYLAKAHRTAEKFVATALTEKATRIDAKLNNAQKSPSSVKSAE